MRRIKEKTFVVCCSSVAIAGLFSMFLNKGAVFTLAEMNKYTLTLDVNQKITSSSIPVSEEQESTVKTSLNNNIKIKYSNVINNDNGWQTISAGGYIYNPVTSDGNNNKISGIQSIKFTTDGNLNLTLYYGYSINNTEIIYSQKEVLEANTKYTFSDKHPSYFYIQNDNNAYIDIDDLTIEYSCIVEEYPMANVNVLMIGNSFADDTIFYASRVAASYGINLNIYNSYIAGCTINTHCSNLINDTASYVRHSMNGTEWDYVYDQTLGQIIDSHTWDIITFQQASAEVGRANSYANLTNLASEVRSRVGNNPKFYWHQTWAYDSDYHDYYDYFAYFDNDQIAMYNAINSCYESEVAPLHLFDKFIPAGTAVQNLRTSYMKETFTRDGKHMSSVQGRYLLALDFLSAVFNVDLIKSPCHYVPSEVNDSFVNVAVECVQNAIANPRAITNSAYTTGDMAKYDLSNYTEIDAGLVGCSYWNETDSSNYNKRQSNVTDTSEIYVSSQRFTSTTLPVGSLVFIDEGFGVRPVGWESDAPQTVRNPETYVNVIEVTNSYWNDFAYRAFNIFKAGKTTLKGQYSQVFDGFHIYVPNSQLSGLKIKGENENYASDKLVFKNSLLNIDAFDRLHLDPITGFYKCDESYELKNKYVDDTAKKFLCSIPFYSANNDLPENTVIIIDSGYQWRSDCWGSYGSYSPRPNNVTARLTKLTSSFWSGLRRRTFNVSSTSSSYVGQNYLEFFNHFRIYVPNGDDINLPQEDTATMVALGTATLTSMAASVYGQSDFPVQITLHGDSTSKVKVYVNGMDMSATGYSYNKNTGAITIETQGSLGSYSVGNITGILDKDASTISNISVSGSIAQYIANNGSITCREMWFDRCNYATKEASQAVWQRWYMSGSWTANTGSGDWTTVGDTYKLDNDYSMGLRIASSSNKQTRFTLKSDFNNGEGFTPHGIGVWIYNPNGNIYSLFRIYIYKSPSTQNGSYVTPQNNQMIHEVSSLPSDQWVYVKYDLNTTIYNISLFFETTSSSISHVYLGHVSFY